MVLRGAGPAAGPGVEKSLQGFLPGPSMPVFGKSCPRSGLGHPFQTNQVSATGSNQLVTIAFPRPSCPLSLPQQKFDMSYLLPTGTGQVNSLFSRRSGREIGPKLIIDHKYMSRDTARTFGGSGI